MTERMKNSFVTKDDNQIVHWNADTLHSDTGLMGMGDGTFMEAGAFKGKSPMMDLSPAELGINMSAYPGMDEFPTDRSAQEAAHIESSNNPFEAPIQQDLTTGGVQFRSEGENVGFISKAQSFIETNSYSLLIGGLLIFSGYYLRGVLKS